ncbi:heme A synthase [Marinomonas agarivorans]|nr:heme A synthase [Marinomonas agarivorans]
MSVAIAHSSLRKNIEKNSQESAHKKAINRSALLMLVLVFCVIGLGAYTRLSDSGLGCPDWPGCYGFLTVPDQAHELTVANTLYPEQKVEYEKGFIEMLHRYIAGCALLMALLLFYLSVKEKVIIGTSPYLKHATLILTVILLQAAFGMWTVTLKLWPQIVVAHLLGGFTTLGLVYLLWLRTHKRQPKFIAFSPVISVKNKHILYAFFVFLFLIGQIFLGGWMAANYAAFACPDLPLCQGRIWPEANFYQGFNLAQQIGPTYLGGLLDGEARVAIHLTHRIGALLTMLAVLLLAFYIFNKKKALAIRLLVVLFLQLTLGMANVWWQIPIAIAVLHNLFAALLMLTLISVLYMLVRFKKLDAKGLNYEL